MIHTRSVNDYRENDPRWRRYLELDDCPGSDGASVWVEPDDPPTRKAVPMSTVEQENTRLEELIRAYNSGALSVGGRVAVRKEME